MAILASDVILSARDRHPAFARERVTHAVLLRALTEYQRALLSRATRRDRFYLAQQASVLFSAQSSTSGAGSGGFPSEVANDGTVSRAEQPTGSAKELETDEGTILVAEFVPASTTTTSVTKTAAGWTVDAYVGSYVEVVAGTGVGQRRVISANTATVASWADALTTALDSTSVVRIVSIASSVTGELGVVTGLPTMAQRFGYLTKLDANGVAYIDLTDPLVATFDRGIPLVSCKMVLGGTVRDSNGCTVGELTLVPYAERFDTDAWYPAAFMNRQLFLIGGSTDWNGVASIDLRYVPEPSALTALTDYFLLPDHAQPALVAHAAYVAGARVQGLEGMPKVDMAMLAQEKVQAENAFLADILGQRQQAVQRIGDLA